MIVIYAISLEPTTQNHLSQKSQKWIQPPCWVAASLSSKFGEGGVPICLVWAEQRVPWKWGGAAWPSLGSLKARGWLPRFREWDDGAFLCPQISQPEVFLDVVERLTVIIAANVSQKVPERSWFPFKIRGPVQGGWKG